MQEAYDFLQTANVYFLATAEKDQPRVRPFGTCAIFNDNIYILTDKEKDVSKQIEANPKIELCAYRGSDWIRITAEAVRDDRPESIHYMLNRYQQYVDSYAIDYENAGVFYLQNVIATFTSFEEGIYRMMKF